MTAKSPGTLNRQGTGRGKNVITKPQPKKRGVNAAVAPLMIQELRDTAPNTSDHEVAETVDPNKPLTEKQRAFAKFWAQGESIATACEKAGYSGSTIGYRLARMPQVIAIYTKEKLAYEGAVGMTRQRVMEGLLDAVEMAKLMAEPASMVSGWREIGRMCGYYEPIKKSIDVTVNGHVVMERMNRLSDAELLKLIEQKITEEVTNGEEDDLDD